ncbi:MAG: chromate efflux transporter [Anaerolineae bacterium]
MTTVADNDTPRQRLWQVCRLFLKLGLIGFGGPAATIAMMEDEVVARRRWLTRAYFLDIVGATNLIPGPNATEIAIQVGYLRAGWPGMALAGLCFILPGALITLGLAWGYVRWGTLPAIAPFLAGIKPAVLAVIAGALWRLGRAALLSHPPERRRRLLVVGALVIAASLLGLHEILALFAGGLAGMLWLRTRELRCPRAAGTMPAFLPLAQRLPRLAPLATVAMAPSAVAPTAWTLFLFFLKVGAVLYGSGYVLIAFLEGGLVQRYGWLTGQQLLDAIAAGQFTPGPLSQTATFVGYLLLGIPGAALATLGMFLPSFIISMALGAIIPHLRRSPWMAAFMDAVNLSALGLMAAVAWKLGVATLTTWPAVVIALLASAAALRWKVNSAWLVLGGAVLGWVARVVA